MPRNLYSLINSASTWFDHVKLSKEVLIELSFWRENLCKCNGVPIWPVKVSPTRIVYSDASSVGCGSVIAIEGKVFQQKWSALESSRSSTFSRGTQSSFFVTGCFCRGIEIPNSIVVYRSSEHSVYC